MDEDQKKREKIMKKAKCIVDYKFFTKTIRGVAKNQGVAGQSPAPALPGS